jgi:hypothetical protein
MVGGFSEGFNRFDGVGLGREDGGVGSLGCRPAERPNKNPRDQRLVESLTEQANPSSADVRLRDRRPGDGCYDAGWFSDRVIASTGPAEMRAKQLDDRRLQGWDRAVWGLGRRRQSRRQKQMARRPGSAHWEGLSHSDKPASPGRGLGDVGDGSTTT